MPANRLEFRILGPLTVRVDGVALPIGGPKQRALLAMLLMSANRVVSREQLIHELFPAQDVESADHALRNHVSRLRKVLRPVAADEPRLVARPPGYLLRVEPGELDLDAFEQLVADAREALADADPEAAAESLRAAETLWEGRPLSDLEFEAIMHVEVERLEELRLAAIEERIEAELALGRQLALVPELESLTVEHPFRERFRAQLMLALYRSGRQAEGLEVYRLTRTLMNDELGIEPGVELQQLERAILLQDLELDTRSNGGESFAATRRDVCPFKGLAPFELADAEFFFGRERLVDELVGRLSETPLIAVVGPSGSGKSSLVRAGLSAALDYESVPIRPGTQPVAQLAAALAGVAPGQRLVLVVDQFEELFAESVGENERRGFIDSLVEAAWDADRRVLVVIALRADFFGRLAAYIELADVVGPNHVLLGPMSSTELRRAIEGPAERTGLEVEPALVDALVDEIAGQAGGLPLLSTALLDLWRERKDHSLTLEAYARTGGVRGAIGRHAEAAFRSLDEDGQQIARRMFLRLVAGGDGEPLTRRHVTRSELDADEDERVRAVLAVLVERRLLVVDDGTVELVHEALLERWQRLVEWLHEDVQGRLMHRHLTLAATEWEAAGRDPSGLYRGARLTAALDWSSEHAADLNHLERQFLAESRADSVREANRQRRANRRLRALLAVTFVLLALAALAAAFAVEKRGQARRDATAAVAQRLGAQALIDPNLDRSLLLAREGMNLVDSEATRSNLLAALLRVPNAVGFVHQGSDQIVDMAMTPDGRTLAVRGSDGNVAFFDAHTLRPVGTPLTGNSDIGWYAGSSPLHALAFSPDSSTLAVGSTTGGGNAFSSTVVLVGARTGEPKTPRGTGAGDITADVAFAPNGRAFATGGIRHDTSPPSEVVVTRKVRDGSELARTRPIPGGRLGGYTPDSRFLLIAGSRSSLLYTARTLRLVRTFQVTGVPAVSPASDRAAFGHADGTVTLLDLHSGRTATLPGRAGGSINAIAFSRDADTIASADQDGTISVWNVRTRALPETLKGHAAAAEAALFSPDGGTLYTSGYDGSLIAWDLGGARRLGAPFTYSAGIYGGGRGSAVSPNGSLYAVSPGPNRVRLWSPHSRAPVGPPLRGPLGWVTDIAFSTDGKLIAAAGVRHAVIWDAAKRKTISVLPVGARTAPTLSLSPNGLTVAIGGSDNVDLYDLRTGRQTGRLRGYWGVEDLDFSPDGKLLATGTGGGSAFVWDVAHESIVSSLHTGYPSIVRFSPKDGNLVAVGDITGKVVFWRLDPTRRFQGAWDAHPVGQPLTGHNGGVDSLDFSPSGDSLVTLDDEKLRLWDVATHKLIGAPLPLPTSNTDGSVHYFPDGKHVLGVFTRGTGVLWSVDPAAWAAKACSIARRNLTPGEWTDFLGHRRYRKVCP
jgi:WD40 repeat protein/DNA-binding SARP family transcriptional activator/ABC-type Fe3+/spermidine/putrescine transport system ATPase subunit